MNGVAPSLAFDRGHNPVGVETDFHRYVSQGREFPHLTAAPEDVPALRPAILSLAAQGQIGTSGKADWQSCKLLNHVTLITDGSPCCVEFYVVHVSIFLRAQNVPRDGNLLLDDMAHVRPARES